MATINGQQQWEGSEKKAAAAETSMKEIWAAAAVAFETICGESLQRGEVKGFEELQRKIENSSKASYGIDGGDDKWEKAKSAGLKSLKCLKMLLGAASQASTFIPIPSAAANITSSALGFVFDIPEAIKGYNDAVNQVFSEVSSALSQFQIYRSMDNVDPLLIKQIQLVLVSFVKVCAHVVKYRQGRKRDRLLRQIKSIFDDDSGLAEAMAEFKRVLQQQRDVEGTVTLDVVMKTQQDVVLLLEQFVVFGKITEETHQAVQETQKGVQSLKDDADRIKTLIKIRDTLGVPAMVRLDGNTTQTCTNISDKCLDGTGSWIWTHDAYKTWTTPKDKDSPRLLIVSGPPSSGKTSACSLITKRLEEQKGRTYVAHFFFPSSAKKSDDEKNPVQSALKYMAFQIARVDQSVLKALGKACDAGPSSFRRSTSLDSLDSLWGELKIGGPGSGAVYYLVFDGLENLPPKHSEMLLKFVFGPRLARESAGRVQILVSGTDDQFTNTPTTGSALRIQMEEQNGPDMRIIVDEALNKRGMLLHAKPDSDQQKARDKIIEKLPQNVKGSYSRLQFGLDDVIRLLSTRTAIRELDRMLDQSTSSHEGAIKNLQRSLTTDEIGELNELLKWVLFCNETMGLDELEAVMYLCSGTESLASLEYIIKNKYSAVLKVEDLYVYGQDGIRDYLQKEKATSGRLSRSREHATISMSITISNVDQELCGHFLWDLAHKTIRDKFNFNFDGDSSNAMHNSSRGAITVDEFEAHHNIVMRAFDYFSKEPVPQTKAIGRYLVCWLPFHLNRLRELEDEDEGMLTPNEQFEIGQNLYKLFIDDATFKRHKQSFEQTVWMQGEMDNMQKWLMDSAIVRRLDKKWRDEVQLATSPTRGYLKELAKMIARGFLRERTWAVRSAYDWIQQLMLADEKKQPQPPAPSSDNADDAHPAGSPSPSVSLDIDETDWDRVSTWCQGILGLPDSELDSIWFERLAEVSSWAGNKPDLTISYYKRAIEKPNPSWLCYRGLGQTHFNQDRTAEAITQVELALKEAQREGATPKPEPKDIVELHLLLGRYAVDAEDAQSATEHYLIACKSDDAEQASQGRVGHLKASLSFPDAEKRRQSLKDLLAQEDGETSMASALKVLTRDWEHDSLVSKLFVVAKTDPDLLKKIVRTMQTATETCVPAEDRTNDVAGGDSRIEEDVARGVLLYDRGVAAYTYGLSPDGTEPVAEALRLWKESRDLLANAGGGSASFKRQEATTALAMHYFESSLDGPQADHIDAMAELAASESQIDDSYAVGLLATLHALRGEKEQARAAMAPRIKQALQFLSDDTPDNDMAGFWAIQKSLEYYQDFENAAIATCLLGQPDLVTDALRFEAGDIEEAEGEDKQRALEMITKLAKEIIQVVKTQVPDTIHQIQRITAAKAHVDALVEAAAKTAIAPMAVSNGDSGAGTSGSGVDEKPDGPKPVTAVVHDLLRSRLSTLQETHTPNIDMQAIPWKMWCDGRMPDGEACKNMNDFETELYHCIYCASRDFCRDCLARLRDPATSIEIPACSAKHRWLVIPPLGGNLCVGLKAKSVPVPTRVGTVDGDDKIIKAYFSEVGSRQEITVEAWKAKVAKEWDISLEEIRNDMVKE